MWEPLFTWFNIWYFLNGSHLLLVNQTLRRKSPNGCFLGGRWSSEGGQELVCCGIKRKIAQKSGKTAKYRQYFNDWLIFLGKISSLATRTHGGGRHAKNWQKIRAFLKKIIDFLVIFSKKTHFLKYLSVSF